jgi:hypothetical protein
MKPLTYYLVNAHYMHEPDETFNALVAVMPRDATEEDYASDDELDEKIFYYFHPDEKIVGDHCGFVITGASRLF